jgi:hypothetical protein
MMLQTEPEKNLSKKENKPFSVKLGAFLNRTKYVLIALVLVLVTALVELLELSVDGDLSLRNITIPFIVVIFATYTGFFIMSDLGKAQGQKSNDYVISKTAYNNIHEKIKQKGYNINLKQFCQYKVKSAREETLQLAFADSTISYTDYINEYRFKEKKELKKMGLPKQDVRLIIKANRLKPFKLVPSMLWTSGNLSKQLSNITASGSAKLIRKRIYKAVRICAMSLLVVSIGTAVALSWSWQILFEVISVIINMFLGYREGYDSYVYTDTQCLLSKTELLEEAYEWFQNEGLEKFEKN